MNKRTTDVVNKAKSLHGKPCSHLVEGGTSGNYCAAFVRYIFKSTLGRDGDFPVVQMPPYYRRSGIRNPPGKWFADSLAGDEIGPAVPIKNMQPGDILFYRDTCFGNWQRGSITHVAMCVGVGGIMADARHHAGTVYVGHYTAMNGELIEVRRPKCLQTGDAKPREINIILKNGKAEAILHGSHVKRLEVALKLHNGALSVHVDHHPLVYKTVEASILPPKDFNYHSLPFRSIGKIGSSEYLKINGHDSRASASYISMDIDRIKTKILFENYALHVWIYDQEIKAREANILIV